MAKQASRRAKRQRKREAPELFLAYLARRPEADPKVLLPRSAAPILRGGFLLHGVLVLDWSLAWLTGFFAAEFLLGVRLGVLGDRWTPGRQFDPELHRRTSLFFQLAWLVVTMAALVFAGRGLERASGGDAFGPGAGSLLGWPGLGTLLYMLLLLVEFVFDLLAARREGRTFVSAGTVQASIFFVLFLLLAFVGVFLAGFVGEILGDAGARGVAAILLVLARAGSDLAVLWMPVWLPRVTAPPSQGADGAARH